MKFLKRKFLLVYLLPVILVLFLIGCSKETNRYVSENVVSVSDNENVKQLTLEEKLEDFEYLYNFIADNYPFLNVNKRVNGVDWLAEKENFRSDIEKTTTDDSFKFELVHIIKKLNNNHTGVLDEKAFSYFYSFYSDPQYKNEYKPWFDVLNDKKVLEHYGFDESKIQDLKQQQQSYKSDISACKTDIIIPDKVAYLRIYAMDSGRIEEDGQIIRAFFEEIKDYDKLIIDIRGNGGGNDFYWMKNVIEPLTHEEISVENYLFYRDDYAKNAYEHRGAEFSLVSELDKSILDSFPDEIETDFKYYHKTIRTIKPVNPVGFKGKIYLLVDKRVYSSAESFAAFCKDSGFAKLVGKTTAGDGIGADPLFFSLPNSGIVIRFSGMLALNGDGTINEEVKTIPDVEIDSTIGSTYDSDKAIQYVIND